MTVKELKELLNACTDEDLVFISSDSEGNNISPMMECSTGVIGTEYDYNNEGNHIIIQEGEDFHYFNHIENKGKRYIVLYPTL